MELEPRHRPHDGNGKVGTPNENGQGERPDIVLVAGQDRTLHVVEVGEDPLAEEPKAVSRI